MNKYPALVGAFFVSGCAFIAYALINLIFVFRDVVHQPDVHHVIFHRGSFNINDGERFISIFDLPFFGWGALLGTFFGSFIILVVARINFKRPMELLAMDKLSWASSRWILFSIVVYVLFTAVLEHQFDSLKSVEMSKMVAMGRSTPILTLVSVGIAIPFFEELIFRGWLFGRIGDILSPNAALWITSVSFTLLHTQYNFLILLFFFPLSFMLGLLRKRSGSLWPSVMVHCANNAIATLIAFGSSPTT